MTFRCSCVTCLANEKASEVEDQVRPAPRGNSYYGSESHLSFVPAVQTPACQCTYSQAGFASGSTCIGYDRMARLWKVELVKMAGECRHMSGRKDQRDIPSVGVLIMLFAVNADCAAFSECVLKT
ncbi:hypothetical protein BaRGS_00009866 [Batillaria attramentaria]|uniref:Uncharacterized protein n=1 Tax=Batillaria attramentaria TaxID=370345 RepID=A0ABD0LIG1_9CAEN